MLYEDAKPTSDGIKRIRDRDKDKWKLRRPNAGDFGIPLQTRTKNSIISIVR